MSAVFWPRHSTGPAASARWPRGNRVRQVHRIVAAVQPAPSAASRFDVAPSRRQPPLPAASRAVFRRRRSRRRRPVPAEPLTEAPRPGTKPAPMPRHTRLRQPPLATCVFSPISVCADHDSNVDLRFRMKWPAASRAPVRCTRAARRPRSAKSSPLDEFASASKADQVLRGCFTS